MGCARVTLLAVALAASAAWGDVYTWTDASGRVQYSDTPPKNFNGVVKRVDVDDRAVMPSPLAPKVAPKPEAAPPAAKPASDLLSKRRADRSRLQHELDVAREKLAAARKELAEHQEPGTGERQMVQRPGAKGGAGLMPGNVQASARSNCRTIENDGKKSIVCPVSVPNNAYYEHIAKLEEAVRNAEEEVATAERAYRRGVD